jgi:alpha-galactosidase
MPTLDAVKSAPGKVVLADGAAAPEGVRLVREWEGGLCRSRLVNGSAEAVRVKEVVLATIPHQLPGETRLYGEGFQMLSQTGGTLAKPVALGSYTDVAHYKLPQPAGATTVYNMLTLSPPGGGHVLVGFASCRRFVGKFNVREASIEAVIETEDLALAPGQTWPLEEFLLAAGPDRPALLAALADRLNANHPPLKFKTVPAGWCSWYCFGPRVTAQQVLDNLDFIARNIPVLRYIQIDDGYQPAMGDWLETGKAFGGGVQNVLKQIAARGFEPAIWVAPFVAEEKSRVFQEHPDWFIKDAEGKPLRSNRVTFGGWRNGPWYAVDGTHPEAQKHLENVFRTMRRQWGCTYFKLDANFWGAMHGGRFHDPSATRVEAYRRGMEAVRRGAGDAFILGCNHPLWPSLGVIHGSRSSMDIGRSWKSFTHIGRENLSRNWQNGRLWWNDPDCVVLTGKLSDDEFRFHATVIYATGGMLLAGDDLAKLGPERLAMLRKLAPPTGVPASFEDDSLRAGSVELKDQRVLCLLNWGDEPQTLTVRLSGPCRVKELWTDEDLGRRDGQVEIKDMPPHSGRVLVCTPER